QARDIKAKAGGVELAGVKLVGGKELSQEGAELFELAGPDGGAGRMREKRRPNFEPGTFVFRVQGSRFNGSRFKVSGSVLLSLSRSPRADWAYSRSPDSRPERPGRYPGRTGV